MNDEPWDSRKVNMTDYSIGNGNLVIGDPPKPVVLVTAESFDALKEEVRVLTEIVYRFLYRQEMSTIMSEIKIDKDFMLSKGIDELFAKIKKLP